MVRNDSEEPKQLTERLPTVLTRTLSCALDPSEICKKKTPKWGPTSQVASYLQLAGKYLPSIKTETLPATGAAAQVQTT